jgi:hypothetical protein
MNRARLVAAVLYAWVRLPWLDILPRKEEAESWIDTWLDYPEERARIKNIVKSRAYGFLYGMRDVSLCDVSEML